MSSPSAEHVEYKRVAVQLAKECSKFIHTALESEIEASVEYKGAVDLVTATDKKVEEFLITELKKVYPTHSFLAEESFVPGASDSPYNYTDNPTWIIDPIDGTTNFVTRQPFFAVSIALAIKKKLVLGVVYNPIRDELFHAVLGGGAYLNDKLITVSAAQSLQQAIIATNVGYDRTEEGIEFMTSNMKQLLKENVLSMRSSGSAALEICYVACGRFTCFYEFGVHPWDVAAGLCILEEAKGATMDPTGGKLNIESRRILAANNREIAESVVAVLGKTKVPQKWLTIQ